MKVALIGDIHANLPALKSVLEHAGDRGVQAIWNIGDFVGYNAFPEECLQTIRRRTDVTSIIGNYDLKVLKVEKKRKKWLASKDPDKVLSFIWSFDQLSSESRQYLRSLPVERDFWAEGWRILLTHGSPASNEEHLTPDTPDERLRELAAMTPAKVIICGHSHRAFTRQAADTWFINTGSVGRPDDGDPRAAYALMEIVPGSIQVEHFRVEYDVDWAVQAIRARGLPDEFAQMIREGRDLKTIKNGQQTVPTTGR
jgi:putative phosphoesterase